MDQGTHAAVAAVKAALAASTSPVDRAVMFAKITNAFYDHTKFNAPGGEGLDGRDGPERRSLGPVLMAALDHEQRMIREARGIA